MHCIYWVYVQLQKLYLLNIGYDRNDTDCEVNLFLKSNLSVTCNKLIVILIYCSHNQSFTLLPVFFTIFKNKIITPKHKLSICYWYLLQNNDISKYGLDFAYIQVRQYVEYPLHNKVWIQRRINEQHIHVVHKPIKIFYYLGYKYPKYRFIVNKNHKVTHFIC